MLLEWLEDAFKLGRTASSADVNEGQTTIADEDANIEVDKDDEADDEARKRDRMELGEKEEEERVDVDARIDDDDGEKKDESKDSVLDVTPNPSTSQSRIPSISSAKKRLVLDTSTAISDNADLPVAPLIKNPMVELFYGQYETDGTIEGKVFANSETFGQFPLQVEGFSDLHESLEAATAPGDIETSGGGGSGDSRPPSGPLPPLPTTPGGPRVAGGQEQWFLKLPPVIMYELSRFHFNQLLGQPEKIHNRLAFPKQIFMVS